MMQPAVFLDRDGTLVEEVGYLDRLERLAFYPWSIDAVRLLNRAGLQVVVISNQAGIARGIFEERAVGVAHQFISERLAAAGATIAGYYYCPHHPEAPLPAYRRDCDCRKPRPGLVRRAERELGLDLPRSFVVGDRWTDVQVANAVGARAILVRTGYGGSEATRQPSDVRVDVVAANLMEATVWILRQLPTPEPRVPDPESR